MAERRKRIAFVAMASAGLALSCVIAPHVARAESVVSESTQVFGDQSNRYEFSAAGAGTLSVTLQDMSWPERLGSLSFQLFSPTGLIGTFSGEKAENFQIDAGGVFAAIVFAHANNTLGLNMGSYSLSIDYHAGPPTVPLPPGMTALLIGLGMLGLTRLRWSAAPLAHASAAA